MTRFVLALLAALAGAPALADMHKAPPAHVEVLPGWRTADGTHMAALRVSLKEGWKTYWRAPGEAGIPPRFDWSGSQNLAEVRFHWPMPQVFVSNGVSTVGYERELVLPMEVVPDDPGQDVTIAAQLHLGVCQDICMPMEAHVSAVLAEVSDEADRQIEAALALRPETPGEAGLVSARCRVEPISDGLRVTAQLDVPALGAGEFAVVEPDDPAIWVSEAMVRRSGNMLTATADLVPAAAQPFDLDTGSLRLTVLADARAVDIQGCVRAN